MRNAILIWWILAIVKILLQFLWSEYNNVCEFQEVFTNEAYRYVKWMYFIIFTLTNFILYTCVLLMLKKKLNLTVSSQNSENSIYTKAQRKMTKVMACIFISFYISYLPVTISIQNFVPSDQIELRVIMKDFSFIFYNFNSVINPVTYLLLLTPFRNAMKTLMCSGKELMNTSTAPQATQTEN